MENVSEKWEASKRSPATKAVSQKEWASYYSRWEWRAIACLADLRDFRADPKWIAKRLGLDEETALSSLGMLESLKILVRNHEGDLVKSKNIQYGSVDPLDVVKSHMLISTEINTRLMDRKKFRYGHYFISTSKRKMEECLRSIQQSVQKLLDDTSTEDSDEVFGLNLSCVSFIKDEENKEKVQ